MRGPVHYHPMETAPKDGSTIRLKIRPFYIGCPGEVYGSWSGRAWVSDQRLDQSYIINPIGWAEL